MTLILILTDRLNMGMFYGFNPHRTLGYLRVKYYEAFFRNSVRITDYYTVYNLYTLYSLCFVRNDNVIRILKKIVRP